MKGMQPTSERTRVVPMSRSMAFATVRVFSEGSWVPPSASCSEYR